MNLPNNKEETDRILFELLEGNLSKQEQEFWYDYSLKNNEFAKQLALFRKMYLQEDMNVYPDHSKLLRRSPWMAFWKSPFFVAGSTLLLGAVAFYTYTLQTPSQTKEEVMPTQTEQIIKEENKELLISPEKDKEELPAKSTRVTPVTPHLEDIHEQKPIDRTPEEQGEVKPAPILQEEKKAPILKDSIKVKEEPVMVEEKKVEEKEEPTVPAQVPKAEEDKQNKASGLKLKVKPSRKTRPTDFNY